MKKLLLTFLLITLLCSCGTHTPAVSSQPEHNEKITVITPDSSLIQTNLATVTQISNDYLEVLKIKLQNPNPPILFYLPNTNDISKFSSILEDLSNEEWVKTLYPNTHSLLSINGRVLAMPDSFVGAGIIYNSTVFNLAGINPQNINSKQRFINAMEVLEKRIQNGDFSKQYPNLKTVFSPEMINVAQNRAVITFASYNECVNISKDYPETSSALHILPIHTDSVDQKILLSINGVWCINKNATDSQKQTAKQILSSLYPKPQHILPVEKDILSFFSAAKTKVIQNQNDINTIYEEIYSIFSKKVQ